MDKNFSKAYSLAFGQRRLFRYYSHHIKMPMSRIDEMVTEFGYDKTIHFLNRKLRDVLIEKLRWN
jgi:hypothetical protein